MRGSTPNRQNSRSTTRCARCFATPDGWASSPTRLVVLDVRAGTTVAASDDSTAHLEFVERGTLTVVSSHDERTRIRRAGPGSVLGMASFFKHGGPSSLVTIRADTDCRVHRLGNEAYFDLVAQHPEVAAALQRYALVAISDRFADLVTS